MKMNSKTFQLPDKPEEQYRFFKGRVVLCILSYQTKKTELRTKRFIFFCSGFRVKPAARKLVFPVSV